MATAPEKRPQGLPAALPYLVAGVFFMEFLDATIILTALPDIARAFGVAPVALNVAVSAYALTIAIFIPASGWAAGRIGGRPVFLAAVIIFTVASILCGISDNLPMLVGARVLQGIGGAMMVPVGRLLVLQAVEKRDLVRAMATISWPALAAPVLGPPLGGLIAETLSWRWIFFVNVPLGAVALIWAWRLLPKRPGESPERRFDLSGFLLTGGACFALVHAFDVAAEEGRALAGLAWFGVAAALSWMAVVHAKRAAEPLLDLSALRLPTFATQIFGGSLFRIAVGAMPFVLPLMLQLSFGFGPFAAGMLLVAVFAGNIAMKPLTGAVLRRWSFRQVLIGNGLLNTAGIAACALLTAETPLPLMAALLFFTGLTRSMQFTALMSLAFADVPGPLKNSANSLNNVAVQLTLGIGIAAGALLLRLGSVLQGDVGAPSQGAFQAAFLLLALLSLIALVDLRRLPRDAGEALRPAT